MWDVRFREIFVDGEALSFMEEGDFDPKNFSKAHNFHWRMFWSKLKTAKTDGVVLKTSFADTAPPQPPAASAAATPVPVSHAAKFVGGYMQVDSTKHRAPRPPVHGLANVGELDLASSLAMVKTECLRLGQQYPSIFNLLGGNVYAATSFIEDNWGDLGPKYAKRGLTKQHAAYLNFYTHESPFYSVVNRLLREHDRRMLVPYKPFLKSFLSACYCLPLQPKSVKRGVKMNLKDDFEEGKEVTWWSITSTTDKVSVLQSGAFLGSKGDRTMFDISARSLVSIKEFSTLPEEEFILLPGTILKVVGVLDAGNGLAMIQLREKEPFIPFLDYVHPDLIKPLSASTPDHASVPTITTPSEATTPERTEVSKRTPERTTPSSVSAPTHSPSSVAASAAAKPMRDLVPLSASAVSSQGKEAASRHMKIPSQPLFNPHDDTDWDKMV